MGDCLACCWGIVFYSSANNKMDLLHNKKEIVMAHLIDKDALVERIKKLKMDIGNMFNEYDEGFWDGRDTAFDDVICALDTLEVKKMDTWHLQEKEDIYDAIKDWSLQTFVCVMKDGTIQKFIGNLDVDYEGHINIHINGVNDDYDNIDDIVKWIELT